MYCVLPHAGEEDVSAEGWRALTLYTQKLGDTVLHLLLSPAASTNPQLVYTLVRTPSSVKLDNFLCFYI